MPKLRPAAPQIQSCRVKSGTAWPWCLEISTQRQKKYRDQFLQLYLSEVSSGLDSCKDWLKETSTLGWGSLWKRFSFIPWFSLFEFPDVSGTWPERTRASGFRRNSSTCDKALKMRPSIVLSSWGIFFVTPSSVFSDTWVKYSSWIPGDFVFWTRLFLGWSSWLSLLTAVNFFYSSGFSYLKKAKNKQQCFKTELFHTFWKQLRKLKSPVFSWYYQCKY